ncbi:hypothetical protein Rs2_30374 [Raphanus sativus]|nr:hypothetical protein Rs2_30374 [Raphanus sativus]
MRVQCKDQGKGAMNGWRDGTSPKSKLLVDVVADGVTEPAHLKIRVKKYVAESRVETDYDAQFKNLVKLVTKLQNQILDKLDGGLKPLAYTTPTRGGKILNGKGWSDHGCLLRQEWSESSTLSNRSNYWRANGDC